MRKHPQTKCPTCRKKGEWLAGAHAPFCSHRCKLVDLGKWLGEEHIISEPLRAGESEPVEDCSPTEAQE